MDEHAYRRLREYNDSLKAIDDTYRAAARRFRLPECAFWILYTLRVERAPLTQSEICALQHQPKQTVHSALKRLEADGLLKLAHGGNRKSKYVCLTEKGARLAERTVDCIAEAEAEALLGLSDGEREALFSLLQKMQQAAARPPRCAGRERHDDGQDLTPERKGRYGNPIIRSFYIQKAAAVRTAVHCDDGVHLGLRRGGRAFRLQLCGQDPFAAINLIMPLRDGPRRHRLHDRHRRQRARGPRHWARANREKANRYFSMMVYRHRAARRGADGGRASSFMRPDRAPAGRDRARCWMTACFTAAIVVARSRPRSCCRTCSRAFLITAEKPQLGLLATVAAGVTNIVLDALFIARLRAGALAGAAVATGISQCVGGVAAAGLLPAAERAACCGWCGRSLELRAAAQGLHQRLLRADEQHLRARW